MKLISMVDFVLESSKQPYMDGSKYKDIVSYAEFLKQPLTLGMFVPCDENGSVLKQETVYCMANEGSNAFLKHKKYWEAKEKVLFKCDLRIDRTPFKQTKRFMIDLLVEDFGIRIYTELQYHNGEIDKQFFPNREYEKIEDLDSYSLTLTPSALKQIGIKE